MQTLILVRQGHCEGNQLSRSGMLDIERLGKRLGHRLNGRRVVTLSSPARPALETAEILKTSVPGDFHMCEHLASHDGEFVNHQELEVMRLVEEKFARYEVVILVTDTKFTDDFPTEWGKGRGFNIGRRATLLGALRIINVEAEREEYLPTW